MRSTRYYPLICLDDEDGDMMPLFSSSDITQMEQPNRLYLTKIIPHYYRLSSSFPLGRDLWQKFRIHCPICGKIMTRMSTPTDDSRLPLYCCPDCSRRE